MFFNHFMQTFKKQERLCNKKQISHLFASKDMFLEYPISLRWNVVENESHFPVKVLIVVSKKNFKRAVDRNRIKRLLREIYRTNKQELFSTLKEKDVCIHLCINYIGKEIPEFHSLELSLKKALQKVTTSLANS